MKLSLCQLNFMREPLQFGLKLEHGERVNSVSFHMRIYWQKLPNHIFDIFRETARGKRKKKFKKISGLIV